jgi:hypothetical protein
MPRHKIAVKQELAVKLGLPFNAPAKEVAKKIVEQSEKKILVDDNILNDKKLCLAFLQTYIWKNSLATR